MSKHKNNVINKNKAINKNKVISITPNNKNLIHNFGHKKINYKKILK